MFIQKNIIWKCLRNGGHFGRGGGDELIYSRVTDSTRKFIFIDSLIYLSVGHTMSIPVALDGFVPQNWKIFFD